VLFIEHICFHAILNGPEYSGLSKSKKVNRQIYSTLL